MAQPCVGIWVPNAQQWVGDSRVVALGQRSAAPWAPEGMQGCMGVIGWDLVPGRLDPEVRCVCSPSSSAMEKGVILQAEQAAAGHPSPSAWRAHQTAPLKQRFFPLENDLSYRKLSIATNVDCTGKGRSLSACCSKYSILLVAFLIKMLHFVLEHEWF